MVEIGLNLPEHPILWSGAIFDWYVELALEAEKAGLDHVLLAEHHALDQFIPDPLTWSAALSVATKRIKIGSHAVCLPFGTHPIRLAEQAACVDVISKGRLVFEVAGGYQPKEFEMFGMQLKKRKSYVEESLQILTKAFAGETVNFKGKWFTVKNFKLRPMPIQRPLLVYYAGWTIPGGIRAARFADGLTLARTGTLTFYKKVYDAYIEECKKLGKTPRVRISRACWVAKDREAAEKECSRDAFFPSFKFFWKGGGIFDLPPKFYPPPSNEEELTIDIMAEDRWIYGSYDEGIAMIERIIKEFKPEAIGLIPYTYEGPPLELIKIQIKRWAEKILPYVKEQWSEVTTYTS
jgi:alkanesulfonate monooxygenase SsuD/methylene tetrahydromethanopterin reductase-like flavin-dependent oxidoreductase (luciferase family)